MIVIGLSQIQTDYSTKNIYLSHILQMGLIFPPYLLYFYYYFSSKNNSIFDKIKY